MTRREKLIERIRRRPVEADFSDVQALLQHFGWTLDRETGSHVTFVMPGEFPINVPKKHGRKVKRYYLDELCKRLRLDEIDD
ncbi:MAG TPA: type II toxin-antitoxin system HicA family toxin [Thermomicrobiales bacterium]|nr:type II toxin-antitoxin system HicA family toxin [Thermomicrobiales bacterium]